MIIKVRRWNQLTDMEKRNLLIRAYQKTQKKYKSIAKAN